MKDALAIALNDVAGFGTQRFLRLLDRLDEVIEEFDILSAKETEESIKLGNYEECGGTDILMLKHQIDHAVRPLYGDRFVPYDDRYRTAQETSIERSWNMRKILAEASCV